MVVIVVVVIPIAIGVPAVSFHVPPAVAMLPAIFASFAQFMARMLGLFAVPAMVFHGFVNAMVGAYDSLLAIVRFGAGRRYKQ